MGELSPGQRTATTAKILMTAGILFVLEAIWRGSLVRTLLAGALLAGGGALLAFARRTD
ncbi:MAG: hypothetical protein JSW68_13955 [Burkholderiales bacterium]|nr:MAG: hypothetical protein JSW68_13955 [Burkholderiales bacterium]